MSGRNAQELAANRKEPIQHLPFFSSTDLQLDLLPADEQSSRLSKLEAARQMRQQSKLVKSTPFSSSFKDCSGVASSQQLSSRDSHRASLRNYHSNASKEDQKLGDLNQLQERYNQEQVDTGESSGDVRQIHKVASNSRPNDRNVGGRISVHSQGLQRKVSEETLIPTQKNADDYLQMGRTSYHLRMQ